MLYEVLKALHIIAVIAWMAGLLYLPRLFVYHADAEAGSKQSETFKVMERRLLRGIMNPAMVLVWILGLLLALAGRLVACRLVANEILAGGRPDLDPSPVRPLAQGFRGRPKYPACPLLSLVERGADGADDRYRVPCSAEAVLTGET